MQEEVGLFFHTRTKLILIFMVHTSIDGTKTDVASLDHHQSLYTYIVTAFIEYNN